MLQNKLSTWMPNLPSVTLPNETRVITIGISTPVILEFYGTFKGEPFGYKHMTPENVNVVGCVHDAIHSVELFLKQMKRMNIAFHIYIPFGFPNTCSYTIQYTQKYAFPLLVARLGIPVEEMLRKNGVQTMFRRWCTRAYKENLPRGVYKHFGLVGVTQLLGMTRFQSPERALYNPANTLAWYQRKDKEGNPKFDKKGNPVMGGIAQKTFPVYNELPIFNVTEAEQRAHVKQAGIPLSPYQERFEAHGCMYCPFKPESYWRKIRDQAPALYAQANAWRLLGSTTRPEEPYYWYRKSKIM